MTDFADWNDTHFDTLPWDGFENEKDWIYNIQFGQVDDREMDGWSEKNDYPDDYFGSEDAHIDSYWESLTEL